MAARQGARQWSSRPERATGGRDIPRLQEFEGRGVWYWASPIEARMCRREEIVLVGGGNSAGQAAVFLSGFAAKICMLVRGDRLAASMSRYLIERIEARPNIECCAGRKSSHSRARPKAGSNGCAGVTPNRGWKQNGPIRNVFLFIGADPATNWLKDCGVLLDRNGFVRTGPSLALDELAMNARLRCTSSSNIFGVFAVGDVRCGSVKRVGGAIGEGAAVVPELHSSLVGTPVGSAVRPRDATQLRNALLAKRVACGGGPVGRGDGRSMRGAGTNSIAHAARA